MQVQTDKQATVMDAGVPEDIIRVAATSINAPKHITADGAKGKEPVEKQPENPVYVNAPSREHAGVSEIVIPRYLGTPFVVAMMMDDAQQKMVREGTEEDAPLIIVAGGVDTALVLAMMARE